MKKVLILLSILVLFLLAGCSGEAKEPTPDWPERLTGTYDESLTFTLNGAEPEAVGSQTGVAMMLAVPAPTAV
ncbi:MAG: hypothetical protein J5633_01660, partial [Oscillospiraceae bacterium]|nr:hypothetical protein [Oscillospiraceae bacterium]